MIIGGAFTEKTGRFLSVPCLSGRHPSSPQGTKKHRRRKTQQRVESKSASHTVASTSPFNPTISSNHLEHLSGSFSGNVVASRSTSGRIETGTTSFEWSESYPNLDIHTPLVELLQSRQTTKSQAGEQDSNSQCIGIDWSSLLLASTHSATADTVEFMRLLRMNEDEI